MLKLSSLIGAGMMLAIGTAGASAPNYASASSLSCGKYANGEWRDDDSIYYYVITRGPFEAGSESGCNIRQFIVAECKLHPQFSVNQAIEDLYAKKTAGRQLPNITICGG